MVGEPSTRAQPERRDAGATGPVSAEAIWRTAERLLDRATPEGILAHKVAPLAARHFRLTGRPIPPTLQTVERAALLRSRATAPLLERIRASCDAPLLLIKGPEVAQLYPGGAREFGDIDLLTPDSAAVHRALLDAGFVRSNGDADFYDEHHHEPPLRWPTMWLDIEVHSRPNWPLTAAPPTVEELLASAEPSLLGVDGIMRPSRLHHALIMAAHAWRAEPLRTLRDLLDVAALAAGLDRAELEEAARAFRIQRIWRTTSRTLDAVLCGAPRPVALRLWARHLPELRERTVLERHCERWLHPFWELPPRAALRATWDVARADVTPAPGETWRTKLVRVRSAVRNPRVFVTRDLNDSDHDRTESAR